MMEKEQLYSGAASSTPSSRVVWLDAMRLVAMVLLLICHAADPFYAGSTYAVVEGAGAADSALPFWGGVWASAVRPCVPLFVMITGALLLPVKESMGTFYRKRIVRVLWPFLVWSVLYYLFPWFTGLVGAPASTIHEHFIWADSDSQSFATCWKNIAAIPYNFNFIACHMWYIYLLVGLYLYLPLFSCWVAQATKRQKEGVLLLWAFTTLMPYFREFVSADAFGTCSWNSFDTFYYFAGFNGYLLLGHYLREHVNLNVLATYLLALPLFAAGYVVTYLGFCHFRDLPGATPRQMELFWTYNTLNVAVMSLAIFLVVMRVKIRNERLQALLGNLTLCGFGVYMIHYGWVGVGYKIVSAMSLPVWMQIPVSALFILAVSWSLAALGKRCLGRKLSKFILG